MRGSDSGEEQSRAMANDEEEHTWTNRETLEENQFERIPNTSFSPIGDASMPLTA